MQISAGFYKNLKKSANIIRNKQNQIYQICRNMQKSQNLQNSAEICRMLQIYVEMCRNIFQYAEICRTSAEIEKKTCTKINKFIEIIRNLQKLRNLYK